MKVLRQDWKTPKGVITSISKDSEQLEETIKQLSAERRETELCDSPDEITIPDESEFADLVKSRTVFLCEDEMDLVHEAPEYQ